LPPACPNKKVCPGSGNACAGNQCCPAYAGSNGLTFPCPDAATSYAGCQSMKPASLVQTTKMDPPFRLCPGSGAQCNGNQCCPGISASDNKTFPCPNADATFNSCAGTLPPACPNKKVCPGSGNACAGNQCCPAYAGSNGLTFPCPDAATSYAGCQSMKPASLVQTTKMDPPFRLCPGSGAQCNGNQCCPGISASDNKTFPCPNADATFNSCEGLVAKQGPRDETASRYGLSWILDIAPINFTHLNYECHFPVNCYAGHGAGSSVYIGEFASVSLCAKACNEDRQCEAFVYMGSQKKCWSTRNINLPACALGERNSENSEFITCLRRPS